jgi:hypothetical protein
MMTAARDRQQQGRQQQQRQQKIRDAFNSNPPSTLGMPAIEVKLLTAFTPAAAMVSTAVMVTATGMPATGGTPAIAVTLATEVRSDTSNSESRDDNNL